MIDRRTVRAIHAVIVSALLAAAGQARADASLGASLSYTHLSYPEISGLSSDVVGLPGSSEWSQPGLRVGFLAPGGRWSVNTDLGLVHRSGKLFPDETMFQLMPQIQVNAPTRGGFSPFVNGGVGVVYQDVPITATRSENSTRPMFGAGIGVRRFISDDHGLIRGEVRYDRLNKTEKSFITFPATNLISVKLGFDLLLKGK